MKAFDKDQLYGEKAVEMGFLSQERFQKILQKQKELEVSGKQVSVRSILEKVGILSPEKIKRIEEAIAESTSREALLAEKGYSKQGMESITPQALVELEANQPFSYQASAPLLSRLDSSPKLSTIPAEEEKLEVESFALGDVFKETRNLSLWEEYSQEADLADLEEDSSMLLEPEGDDDQPEPAQEDNPNLLTQESLSFESQEDIQENTLIKKQEQTSSSEETLEHAVDLEASQKTEQEITEQVLSKGQDLASPQEEKLVEQQELKQTENPKDPLEENRDLLQKDYETSNFEDEIRNDETSALVSSSEIRAEETLENAQNQAPIEPPIETQARELHDEVEKSEQHVEEKQKESIQKNMALLSSLGVCFLALLYYLLFFA